MSKSICGYFRMCAEKREEEVLVKINQLTPANVGQCFQQGRGSNDSESDPSDDESDQVCYSSMFPLARVVGHLTLTGAVLLSSQLFSSRPDLWAFRCLLTLFTYFNFGFYPFLLLSFEWVWVCLEILEFMCTHYL